MRPESPGKRPSVRITGELRASLAEVAAALAALTGEPHPLATGGGW